MATKRRKIVAYRLTISGLARGTQYSQYLIDIRQGLNDLENVLYDHGGKTHALARVNNIEGRAHLSFFSYTEGFRPDILDTEDYDIQPNPLNENQTGIEWTHVVGIPRRSRYILAIESVQSGIHPQTIAGYLQSLIDRYRLDVLDENAEDLEERPVVVTVEPDPGAGFIPRVNSLQRVTKATFRQVRPNPGWDDFEDELAGEADESDAAKADVTMTARRRGTLRKNRGIVKAIKDSFEERTLSYASFEGRLPDGKEDSFSTANFVRSSAMYFQLDGNGQVVHDDAFRKITGMALEID